MGTVFVFFNLKWYILLKTIFNCIKGCKMKRNQPPKKRLHDCDFPGCPEAGEYRAPKDRTLTSYYWFCQKHVAEYNKNWDFLKGLSPDEIEDQIQNDVGWQRPTWKLGTEGIHYRADKIRDDFGVFKEAGLGMSGHYNPPRPKYPAKVTNAMAFMQLEHPLTLQAVKKKYKALAKKYHPDISKKDASLFQKLTEANETLIQFLNKG